MQNEKPKKLYDYYELDKFPGNEERVIIRLKDKWDGYVVLPGKLQLKGEELLMDYDILEFPFGVIPEVDFEPDGELQEEFNSLLSQIMVEMLEDYISSTDEEIVEKDL